MQVRTEKPEDVEAIRKVNVAEFERVSEADLVDQLRGVDSTFSLVAVEFEQIVGYIFFSPVEISRSGHYANIGEWAGDELILGLAPIAVLPDYQRQGIPQHAQCWPRLPSNYRLTLGQEHPKGSQYVRHSSIWQKRIYCMRALYMF